MKSELWQKIDALVQAALELQPKERMAFLDEMCQDVKVRTEAESLIYHAEKVDNFLERPAMLRLQQKDRVDTSVPSPNSPTSVGCYRIERLLGAGGMGAVYLAVRADEEYEQKVAIKLLHSVIANQSLVKRLRAERQILAGLDHPNIAKLLDGGTTDQGQPYLVLEYVRGLHIDTYCDQHQLPVRQRIELFLQVCSAVRYAHSNLVVHRDLKPSNILVTEDGILKLLDFGIAKLLDPGSFPQTVEMTQTGVRPMSISYASPEQIRGKTITTASDIYSLGVLLYRLLTGRPPRVFESVEPEAIERVLCAEPTAPSVAVLDQPEHPDTDFSPDRLSPLAVRAISRTLRGDLDNIMLMAMREEPKSRYGSVFELIDDLQRYLDNLPVRARRQYFGYRTGKMLRRNKVVVAVTSALIALVLGFSVSTTVQSRRITRERDRAQYLAKFMVELFQASEPGDRRADTITAREILDRGAERIGSELADQPEVYATLLHTIGQIYRDLGVYDRSLDFLQQALEIRQGFDDLDPSDLVSNLNELGQTNAEFGRLDRAYDNIEQALTIGEASLDKDDWALAISLQLLADICTARGEFERASGFAERSVAIAGRSVGEDHSKYATALERLGNIRYSLGDLEHAAEIFARALEINQKALGPDHVNVAAIMNNLGMVRWKQGDLLAAEDLMQRSLVIDERLLGPDHPRNGTTVNNLGLIHQHSGDLASAEAFYNRALEIKKSSVGENSPSYAASLNNLASVLFDRGELTQASELWVRVLEVCRDTMGDRSQYFARTLVWLSRIDHVRGERSAAEERLTRAIEVLEEVYGSEHSELVVPLSVLAEIYFDAGEFDKAETVGRSALENTKRNFGEDHPKHARQLYVIGRILVALGRSDEAWETYQEAFGILSNLQAQNPTSRTNERFATVHVALGDWYMGANDPGNARQSWTEAVRLLKLNPDGSVGAQYMETITWALLRLGRLKEAQLFAGDLLAKGWRRPLFVKLCTEAGLIPDEFSLASRNGCTDMR